jgi:SAM-dependent methyltransferase
MDINSKEQLIQEGQYNFPYHFIPTGDSVWTISRHLGWGYEYLAILETITNLVVDHHPGRALDFGCGDGRLVYELYKKGIPKISGIDFSERALLFSQAMVKSNDKVGFFTDLEEVRGQQFDVVTAVEVLEHIPPNETKSILAAIHKVLDEKGSLIVSVPTKNVPLNRKHYRHFTIFELEKEIAELFAIERVYFIHRVGAFGKILRRAVVNKFFIPQWAPWVKLTTILYKWFVMKADESDGAHLIAVLRKADRGS